MTTDDRSIDETSDQLREIAHVAIFDTSVAPAHPIDRFVDVSIAQTELELLRKNNPGRTFELRGLGTEVPGLVPGLVLLPVAPTGMSHGIGCRFDDADMSIGCEFVSVPAYPSSAIGNGLRAVRQFAGLYLHDAARRIGLTTVQLSQLECGRWVLSDEDYHRAAVALGGPAIGSPEDIARLVERQRAEAEANRMDLSSFVEREILPRLASPRRCACCGHEGIETECPACPHDEEGGRPMTDPPPTAHQHEAVEDASPNAPSRTLCQRARSLRHGGLDQCPRRCSECSDGAHHFGEGALDVLLSPQDLESTDDAGLLAEQEELRQHPAALAGCTAWWSCYHCDAWLEYDPEAEEADLDDPEEVRLREHDLPHEDEAHEHCPTDAEWVARVRGALDGVIGS